MPLPSSERSASAEKALDAERKLLKAQIKLETKKRKQLCKDDFAAKAASSQALKALKKALGALEAERSALNAQVPDGPAPSPAEVEHFPAPFSVSQDLKGWEQFIAAQSTSLYHHLDWRPIFADVMGRDLKYLTARDDDGAVIGVLPIAITHSPIFGHYGISLPYMNYGSAVAVADNVEMALIRHAFAQTESWGISHLELRDIKSRAELTPRTDKVCMSLSLSGMTDLNDLKAMVGSKVRSQINKSLASGIEFSMGGTELLTDFYKVFSRNMRDLGTPVYGIQFFASILETFSNQAHLVVGYYQGRPISCAFLLNQGASWEIPWASTIRSGNNIAANMALYATVLQEVIKRGAQEFDFGRSSIDAPTYRFKKQWGAQPRQLYWYYADSQYSNALTTTSSRYQLAIRAWQKLPLTMANRLGPALVKNLP